MNFEGVLGVFGLVVLLGIVATTVQSRNTAGIISSVGNAFSESIRAAKGQ